jgi:hypothetical protein
VCYELETRYYLLYCIYVVPVSLRVCCVYMIYIVFRCVCVCERESQTCFSSVLFLNCELHTTCERERESAFYLYFCDHSTWMWLLLLSQCTHASTTTHRNKSKSGERKEISFRMQKSQNNSRKIRKISIFQLNPDQYNFIFTVQSWLNCTIEWVRNQQRVQSVDRRV